MSCRSVAGKAGCIGRVINDMKTEHMMQRNLGHIDGMVRVFGAELSLLAAFFWTGGTARVVAYAIGAVLLLTAASGVCPLYRLIGTDIGKGSPSPSKRLRIIFTVTAVLIAVAGSYSSVFFTTKLFLEDFNRMNGYYKQTLFNTGQDRRVESVTNYEALVAEYGKFAEKYAGYRPYVIRSDAAFDVDIRSVGTMIATLSAKVRTGNLPDAHKELEAVRPIFQEMLKRNGFSMLAVSLVDFHDAMEKVIAPADAKDAAGVIGAYPEADMKLKAVEEAADDAEIMAIRGNLEAVRSLAAEGKIDLLPAKAAELKSSFVKVYLKRG